MEDKSQVNVSVSENLVKPIIEAKIEATIIEALGGADKIIGPLVYETLMRKCNSEGKVENYGSYNKFTYLEVLCTEKLKAAAKVALEKFIADRMPTIENQIEFQLRKQSSAFAKIMVDGLKECMKTSWQLKCDVQFKTLES